MTQPSLTGFGPDLSVIYRRSYEAAVSIIREGCPCSLCQSCAEVIEAYEAKHSEARN